MRRSEGVFACLGQKHESDDVASGALICIRAKDGAITNRVLFIYDCVFYQ